jgi:hypothetical protein
MDADRVNHTFPGIPTHADVVLGVGQNILLRSCTIQPYELVEMYLNIGLFSRSLAQCNMGNNPELIYAWMEEVGINNLDLFTWCPDRNGRP